MKYETEVYLMQKGLESFISPLEINDYTPVNVSLTDINNDMVVNMFLPFKLVKSLSLGDKIRLSLEQDG